MDVRNTKPHIPDLLKGLRLSPLENVGGHLTDEEFVGYMLIEEHLATCPDCADEVKQLAEATEAWQLTESNDRRLELRDRVKASLVTRLGKSRTATQLLELEPALAPSSWSKHTRGLVERPISGHRALLRIPDEPLVAIDIGSSKVGVLIGQRDDKGGIEVVGKGLAPNRGTRRGNIVNVEATVEALKAASEEAEVMAGVKISRAYVGVAGADIRSVNSHGMVSLALKDREVTLQDIQRVLKVAQSTALPSDREILHAIPREFIVDEQGGIDDPLGMLGTRVEAMVHLVTGNVTRSRTLLAAVNRAGIEVVQMVFEPLATAEAVLTPDERELGALLIDVGAGTTEYALFAEGEILYSAVAPIGAGHFTNDLAMVLRAPFAEAERIKVKQGSCLPSMVTDEKGVAVPTVAGGTSRIVPKRELCEILQPRAEELFTVIREDLERHVPDERLRGGVILTGGGAQLEGLLEICGQIFATGVRYGLPRGLGGLVDVISSPTWATALGLLLYAKNAEESQSMVQKKSGFSVHGMVSSLRGIFSDLF
jgi:cell division protein FtsA